MGLIIKKLEKNMIEKKIEYNGEIFMTWEYKNSRKLNEIAIMDPTGYDVSLMTFILKDGKTISKKIISCVDNEEYIHKRFVEYDAPKNYD